MYVHYLTEIIVSIVSALALAYLAKAINKQPAIDVSGKVLMRVHKSYYVMGIVSLLMAALFVCCLFIYGDEDWKMSVLFLVVAILFGLLGERCVMLYKRHWVSYDESVIMINDTANIVHTWKWSDFKEKKLDPNSGYWRLKNGYGDTVKIHQHLMGFSHLKALLQQKAGLKLDN